MENSIQHTDNLGQPVEVNQHVAFSSAYIRGVKLGRVVKLTQKRIRIAYTNIYTDSNNTTRYYECEHIARPCDVIVLNDSTQQWITLTHLKGAHNV